MTVQYMYRNLTVKGEPWPRETCIVGEMAGGVDDAGIGGCTKYAQVHPFRDGAVHSAMHIDIITAPGQLIHLSIYPSIPLSLSPSIHLSGHLSIYPSTRS